MSSTVISEYDIETGRLQQIVVECSHEVSLAEYRLEQQQDRIQNIQAAYEQREREFERSMRLALENLRAEKQKEELAKWEQRTALMHKLMMIGIEMEAFCEVAEELTEARKMQAALEEKMQNSQASLEELQREIEGHEAAMHQEMQHKRNYRASLMEIRIALEKPERVAIEKGLSLEVENAAEQNREKQRSVTEVFAEKLQKIMASEQAKKLYSAKKMAREFEETPPARKAVFAVEHMKTADQFLEQLKSQEKAKEANMEAGRKAVIRYVALCEQAGIVPNEELAKSQEMTEPLRLKIEELEKELPEIAKRNYVKKAYSEVMSRFDIQFQDSENQAGIQMLRYRVDDSDLYLSEAGNGIVTMEVEGTYAGNEPSMDDKRKAYRTNKKVCSLVQKIQDALAEDYKIYIRIQQREEPEEATIPMKHSNWHGEKHLASRMKEMSKTV